MKRKDRLMSLALTGVMLLGLIPAASLLGMASNDDAGQYIPVYLDGYTIMNGGITSDMPTRNYRDTEGDMDDKDVNLTALDPEGKVSHASNANQMPEDLAAYNMIQCFGRKNAGDTDVSGAASGFSCPEPTSGNSDKDSDEKVRKAQMVNYGSESEANNKGEYNLTFGMNADEDYLDEENQTFDYYVYIGENDALKKAAAGGGLEFYFSGLCVSGHEAHSGDDDHCRCQVWCYRDGSEVGYGDGTDRTQQHHLGVINTGWQHLNADSTIHIKVDFSEVKDGTGDTVGLCEGVLLFRDAGAPTLSSYSGSTNATVNANNSQELLMKLGVKNPNDPDDYYYTSKDYASDPNKCDHIQLNLQFSEPVTAGTIANGTVYGISDEAYEKFSEHTLFNNTSGTGFPNQGAARGLVLQESAAAVGTGFVTSLTYRYNAVYGDNTGNNPIRNGGSIENNGGLLSKIGAAGFHDAAGNPLSGVDGSKGSNIFDKNDGGYDVIVDAMPPTYSRAGNGVTPDILTQLVLNDNDTVDFIVSFSEAAITRRDWDNARTYLMLNNGDKAYFKSKSADGKQWVFTYTFGGGTSEEASLLKVIALANDALDGALQNTSGGQARANLSAYTYYVDARTITDYVGNMMVERANEDSSTNTDQIESSIGWAGLAVDNTVPDITFDYSVLGTGTLSTGTDTSWGQAAKVLASAVDPDVPVAKYDPDYASGNTARPSKGIYRPDNTTGSTASAVGLIFYVWTRSATPPDAGDNYEAIKRYSLTGESPKTVDRPYAAAWNWDGESVDNYVGGLMMANNFSDIVPPDAAMTSAGDGAWYLHVWTADMTWDSARQLMQYEKANSLQYKSGYSNAAYLELKQEKIDEYRDKNTKNNSTPSHETAWDNVKAAVYNTAFTGQFIQWLDASGSDRYSDAAMLYARSQAMLTLTKYEDTEVWPLSDFSQPDSNWTVQTARLLLDNTAPSADAVFQAENMIGDGTAAVELPFTVSDALGGIDTERVYYQWVLKGGAQTPDEVQWAKATPDSTTSRTNALTDGMESPAYGAADGTFTARTLGNVVSDGTYILYLKYCDVAGNERIVDSGSVTVTVNTANTAMCAFGPEDALTSWQNEIVPTVEVTGLTVGKLAYAVTDQISRPDTSAFAELAAAETGDKAYSYTLPALNDEENTRADGTWYVHILVYENEEQTVEPHYYRQAYRLDRTKPVIVIDPNGFAAAQDTIDAVVGFSDELSGMSADKKYRISADSAAIDASADGWLAVPESGRITLSAEDAGSYYLHVMAADQAGNVAIKVSAAFELRGTKAPSVLPPYSCQLLTTYTAEDGKTYGVANLTLDTEDKAGYRYSVTTNGRTWCNWLPYMSMIRLQLPQGYRSGDLMVKFRAPDGVVGEPQAISIQTISNAIWATAEFDSTFKRKSVANGGAALTLLMAQPDGVTATPTAAREDGVVATAVEEGNFTVAENGVYAFELARGAQKASTHLIVVVDIFDDIAPDGYISYSEVAPTNGTVVARVMADETIRVNALRYKYDGDADYTETTPRAQFGFERNGTAEFTIEDEAHNAATVTATVSNIDKNAPNVKVEPNYDLYETVGSPLIASGATLEVKKGTEEKDGYDIENFDVVNNDRSATREIEQNGSYEFIVQDKVGNVSSVTHEATNIVKTLPDYTVTYTYSDTLAPVDAANPRRADVQATVRFAAVNDGRQLYSGAAKIDEYRNATVWDEATNSFKTEQQRFTNVLELDGGQYVYTRVYSANGETALVFCDDLGNVERVPINVTGIDKTAPTLTLNKDTAVISSDQTKRLGELTADEITELFGGYTVTDNACAAERISVTLSRGDDKSKSDAEKGKLNEVGKFTLVYTAADGAGNVSYAEQTLIVIPADGLLIEAGDEDGNNYALLSGSAANSAILPDNHVTFRIDEERMQSMFYNNYGASDESKKVQNSDMRYDIFYTPGLYREGQLKTIATQLTGEELTGQDFHVTFPKAGWYTIIIRNQERTREYTTFFIASTSD